MRALAFLPIFGAVVSCCSQGTVNFANGAAGVDAPFINGMVTPHVRASGPGFQAQLYVGPAGTVNSALLTTNGVSGTPAPFETGAASGYFFGSARTIEGYAPGTIVTLQVRAWATSFGPNWETAGPIGRGESNLIQISLGGGTIPTPNMVGLQGIVAAIPEPSSVVIAALGVLATLVFGVRRRAGHG